MVELEKEQKYLKMSIKQIDEPKGVKASKVGGNRNVETRFSLPAEGGSSKYNTIDNSHLQFEDLATSQDRKNLKTDQNARRNTSKHRSTKKPQ